MVTWGVYNYLCTVLLGSTSPNQQSTFWDVCMFNNTSCTLMPNFMETPNFVQPMKCSFELLVLRIWNTIAPTCLDIPDKGEHQENGSAGLCSITHNPSNTPFRYSILILHSSNPVHKCRYPSPVPDPCLALHVTHDYTRGNTSFKYITSRAIVHCIRTRYLIPL
jgi:hypothetical protein